ncbi:MAG: hypothetical protein VKL60_15060 [Sphaerospermopsis sp.]|nr:hypothetical protein [Sphaerospermopsis sp.]
MTKESWLVIENSLLTLAEIIREKNHNPDEQIQAAIKALLERTLNEMEKGK